MSATGILSKLIVTQRERIVISKPARLAVVRMKIVSPVGSSKVLSRQLAEALFMSSAPSIITTRRAERIGLTAVSA